MQHTKLIFLGIVFTWFFASCQTSQYFVQTQPKKVIATYNKSLLLGTNAGIYYEESYFMNHRFLDNLRAIHPGIIRMPGGSWSNELYWNGNKVRLSEESYIDEKTWVNTIKKGGNPLLVAFDTSKYKNNLWEVDYAGYAPGFRIKDLDHHLSDFHGFTDVLFLHKFIRSFDAETMVTVNLGTGTVQMAVEWVKWVKDRKDFARAPFRVKYWEMGNELDGDWELGYILPDGSKMNAAKYVHRYKLFAKAMKKEDPSIKVGGSVASSMKLKYIKELIQDTDAPIDFISFHAYPSNNKEIDFVKMLNEAKKVNDAVAQIKNWLALYRPGQKNKIKIAVTEWNIKVKEDITTVNMTNALWSAAMIGEMAKAGVDMAMQWDLFSTTPTGGHGLFNPKDKKMTPRAQYWAMFLWANYMGNQLLKTTHNTPEYIQIYHTIDKKHSAIMLINGSLDKTGTILLELPQNHAKNGKEITFSAKHYGWDEQNQKPTRSLKPSEKSTKIKSKHRITLPPQTIKIFRY